jgi:hypothetical protein
MNTLASLRRSRSCDVLGAALVLALGGVAGCVAATDGESLATGEDTSEAPLAGEASAAAPAEVAAPAEAARDEDASTDRKSLVASERWVQRATVASKTLAAAAARALAEPEVRRAFFEATRTSSVKEGKVFLRSFLGGEGKAMLGHMARSMGKGHAAISQLLDEAGPMEIYLPVEAHRAAWRGDDHLLVATQLDEKLPIHGFDLQGAEVALSPKAPPETPVISIVPAESFSAEGASRDAAAAPRSLTSGPASLTSYTGLWINQVDIGGSYESWPRGAPEYEMHLQSATSPRNIIVCAEESSSVEPYRWNMDGSSYTADFLIAGDSDMPANVPMVIAVYEDDDTRCVIKTDKDYVKLSVDLLTNSASVYEAIASKQWLSGAWIVNLSNAVLAARSIVSGNDEFVGVSAGLSNIGTSEATLTLRNHNGTPTGLIVVQRKTDVAH